MPRLFVFLLIWGLPLAAQADLSGRVVGVHDGDTLTIAEHGRKIRVRLDGIDAPELEQRYGWAALRSLAHLCRGTNATVTERGKDEEGDILGSVVCGKTDANAEQVKRGFAWVFRTYLPLGSPLYELETNARLMQRGLWHDKNPTPPWEWRKQHARRH